MSSTIEKEIREKEAKAKRAIIKSRTNRILIPLLFVLLFKSSSASATAIITIGDSDIFSEVDVTVPLMINDVEDVAAATIKVSYDSSVIVVTDVGIAISKASHQISGMRMKVG
jgi:zona occludens toxin (predicted ATPase)